MGFFDGLEVVSRRKMTLFFVVDTSGSMSGSKIGTVNSVIEEVIPEIRNISEKNADAEISIAVLEFSNGARWETPQPMDPKDFKWNYLNADGLTDFGEMCKCLNEKLSRKAFMGETAGAYAPAIFLLSDGEPTDDYARELQKLQENKWFKSAIKVAIAIGEDANKQVLTEFTGHPEAVLTVHTPEALAKMIRFVSIRSSQIGSRSSGVGGAGVDQAKSKQDEMNEALADTVAADPSLGVQIGNTPSQSQDNWDDWD